MRRLLSGGLLVAGLGFGLGAAAPASAEVCAAVTTYEAGRPTTTGPVCQSLLDDLPPQCVFPVAVFDGYGVEAAVCVPLVV